MKTAISIPDDIFEEAESVAQSKGMSRSQLYVTALAAYLRAHRSGSITEQLNRVYDQQPGTLDPGLAALQSASLHQEDW
jgi:metal-responsive CopG/Arc/MetJ family transcriptional regulator